MTATITAYAYETVANKAITIGSNGTTDKAKETGSVQKLENGPVKDPSLGALALGAPGLEIWRRQQ